jgi:hypothetical protein
MIKYILKTKSITVIKKKWEGQGNGFTYDNSGSERD